MEPVPGVLVKGIGGFYYVRGEDGRVVCLRAKGRFRHNHLTPTIGDRVLFCPGNGEEEGWIEEILPRSSELIRPAVANVRYLLLTLAPRPEPDFLLLDTLLIMARQQHISPVLVVNKWDLDEGKLFAAVQRQYRGLGAPVLGVSGQTGRGLEELRQLLREGICCFAGQSGVGKSTLVSAATGIELQTGEISRKISRGRHTTRHAELLFREDYCVLDTPGFSLLELWEGLEPVELKQYYPEFEPYEGLCRFSPCYHLSEPDCAVLSAAKAGEIDGERLERYHQLLKKVQEAWKKRYD